MRGIQGRDVSEVLSSRYSAAVGCDTSFSKGHVGSRLPPFSAALVSHIPKRRRRCHRSTTPAEPRGSDWVSAREKKRSLRASSPPFRESAGV